MPKVRNICAHTRVGKPRIFSSRINDMHSVRARGCWSNTLYLINVFSYINIKTWKSFLFYFSIFNFFNSNGRILDCHILLILGLLDRSACPLTDHFLLSINQVCPQIQIYKMFEPWKEHTFSSIQNIQISSADFQSKSCFSHCLLSN